MRDIVSLAGANSSWRDKVLGTRNNRSLKEIGMAQLPFLGKTIRTDHPFKLVIKSTEELEEFVRILETDEGVNGGRLKLFDIIGKKAAVSIENDKEYEQSEEPYMVFSRVCEIILPVARKIEEGGINLFLKTVYIDTNSMRLAHVLPKVKIGNVVFDSSSILSNKDAQKAISLLPFKSVGCITTTPLVVGFKEGDKLENIKMSAVARMSSVLRTVIESNRSIKELVIDPTILYRDSSGRFVDIDPKREFAIKTINDNIITTNRFYMQNYDSANITILAPRAAEEVSLGMGGLLLLAPNFCQEVCQQGYRTTVIKGGSSFMIMLRMLCVHRRLLFVVGYLRFLFLVLLLK